MDNLTKSQRSLTMSRIRSQGTHPEKKLRSCLHKKGFRFRKNVAALPGKPDIVLPKYKTIIFVHGCFWHQHFGCKKANIPKTNTQYWKDKLKRNVEHDNFIKSRLVEKGWSVKTVWECEIKNNLQEVVESITKRLKCKSQEPHGQVILSG